MKLIAIIAPQGSKNDAIRDENICLNKGVLYQSLYNIPNKSIEKRKIIKKSAFDYENSIEYRILVQTFSSGVTLKELGSIALIICTIITDIKKPCRNEKRNYPLLIEWYHNNWNLINPILPFIQLRDENKEIINGKRELDSIKNKSG